MQVAYSDRLVVVRGSVSYPAARVAGFYIFGLFTGVGIFGAVFLGDLFSFLGIMFYRGLVILLVAALFHAIIMVMMRSWIGRDRIHPANVVSSVALATMLNLTFFTLVPVNLDRSISVFLLAWMDQSDGRPMTEADLREVFEKVYVDRYHAMDRRIDEQLASGDIRKTAAGYVLTERGYVFVRFAKAVGWVFSVDRRFLQPHCTEAERAVTLPGCRQPATQQKAAG